MALPIRAIYENGHLRLLTPVRLVEGQEVTITIEPSLELTPEDVKARLRSAGILADVHDIPEDIEELSEEELLRLGSPFVGDRPSEELIDGDRGEYLAQRTLSNQNFAFSALFAVKISFELPPVAHPYHMLRTARTPHCPPAPASLPG